MDTRVSNLNNFYLNVEHDIFVMFNVQVKIVVIEKTINNTLWSDNSLKLLLELELKPVTIRITTYS